jgi:hypothetical protein
MIKYFGMDELSKLFSVIKEASICDHALFSLAYCYGLRVSISLASSTSGCPAGILDGS